jgi:hypothetical protein
MNKTELAIQFHKIATGIAFAAYFLWWSLSVLERLPAQQVIGEVLSAKRARRFRRTLGRDQYQQGNE